MHRSNLAKSLTTGSPFWGGSSQNFGGGPKYTLAHPLKFFWGGGAGGLCSATPECCVFQQACKSAFFLMLFKPDPSSFFLSDKILIIFIICLISVQSPASCRPTPPLLTSYWNGTTCSVAERAVISFFQFGGGGVRH